MVRKTLLFLLAAFCVVMLMGTVASASLAAPTHTPTQNVIVMTEMSKDAGYLALEKEVGYEKANFDVYFLGETPAVTIDELKADYGGFAINPVLGHTLVFKYKAGAVQLTWNSENRGWVVMKSEVQATILQQFAETLAYKKMEKEVGYEKSNFTFYFSGETPKVYLNEQVLVYGGFAINPALPHALDFAFKTGRMVLRWDPNIQMWTE